MKKTLLLFILCAAALLATAQNYERYGGVYFAYPETPHTQTPPPPGYEPCYITMFTRVISNFVPAKFRKVKPAVKDKKNRNICI